MKPSKAQANAGRRLKFTTALSLCVAAAPTLAACGTTLPPAELVAAREVYGRAYGGDAERLQPAKVYEAKKALDEAEAKFAAEGDAQSTRDLAYIAQRKAEYAEVEAARTRAQQTFASADREMRAMTGQALEHYRQQLAQQQVDLERQRQMTEKEKATAEEARAEAERQRMEAEKERAARAEADRRIKQALADLGKLASMREEARGTVITLTGSVLFEFGKANLLPSATRRLNDVADALKSEPNTDITIEGYTDNVGAVSTNLELSQMRADRVRDYLIGRGVAQARIRAVGKGQANPIASNATPEGRANNRRVEIILSAGAEKKR